MSFNRISVVLACKTVNMTFICHKMKFSSDKKGLGSDTNSWAKSLKFMYSYSHWTSSIPMTQVCDLVYN